MHLGTSLGIRVHLQARHLSLGTHMGEPYFVRSACRRRFSSAARAAAASCSNRAASAWAAASAASAAARAAAARLCMRTSKGHKVSMLIGLGTRMGARLERWIDGWMNGWIYNDECLLALRVLPRPHQGAFRKVSCSHLCARHSAGTKAHVTQ